MRTQVDLKTRVGDWIFKLKLPETAPIKLHRRRVFILPTKTGTTLVITLLFMLIGSINYNLSLGYVLTFLLASLAIISILHTFRNIANLEIDIGRTESVFVGDEAQIAIVITNPSTLARYSIGLRYQKNDPVYTDAPIKQSVVVKFPVMVNKRGWLRLERINIFTQYPMGLFNAWSNAGLNLRCLAYPKPDHTQALPELGSHHAKEGTQKGIGTNDFSGLREHQPSDSPKHIAWKALAREHGMLTKQFTGQADHELWLDWYRLASSDIETKLSILCGWILKAENNGQQYGLRLPNLVLEPNQGEAHKQNCLKALALYNLDDSN